MKQKSSSVKVLLFISLAVFIVGLLLASLISTNNGKTEMRRLYVMTDRGVAISLEVYKPKTATRETPAPAVMLIPGGNASVEYMSTPAWSWPAAASWPSVSSPTPSAVPTWKRITTAWAPST